MRFRVPGLPLTVQVDRRAIGPVRIHLRTTMLLVALCAILLFAAITVQQYQTYSRLAEYHAIEEAGWRDCNVTNLGLMQSEDEMERLAKDAALEDERELASRRSAYFASAIEEVQARIDYHSKMKIRYSNASQRPWIRFDPHEAEPPVHGLHPPQKLKQD